MCPATMNIAFKHDIAIEVDSESYNCRCNESLKGMKNTPTLFLYLNELPLRI